MQTPAHSDTARAAIDGERRLLLPRMSHRTDRGGVHTVEFARVGCTEYFVTAPLRPGERPESLFPRAAAALRACGATAVSMEVAGVAHDLGPLIGAFGPIAWPVTWIDRSPGSDTGGVHIWAIAGPVPTPIARGGEVIGVCFEDLWARYCRLGGLGPANPAAAWYEQALSVFNGMESTLRGAGMTFADVVRTWFFNRDITAWYGVFNRVRNAFFELHGLFQGRVPASTGVGSGDIGEASLTAGLLAVRPKRSSVRIAPATSPLQGPATAYGSAFSRALAVECPDHVRLLVSGTASIAPQGQTEHDGDAAAQVDRTFDVVGALLESRAMSWGDVVSGFAYVKRAADVGIAKRRIDQRQLGALPLLFVHADICRDDLLFELEVNAVSPRRDGGRAQA